MKKKIRSEKKNVLNKYFKMQLFEQKGVLTGSSVVLSDYLEVSTLDHDPLQALYFIDAVAKARYKIKKGSEGYVFPHNEDAVIIVVPEGEEIIEVFLSIGNRNSCDTIRRQYETKSLEDDIQILKKKLKDRGFKYTFRITDGSLHIRSENC